jgi:hypothetical protein
MEDARKRAMASGLPLILCLDGGWAHRGFHSKQACLPVIDFWTGDVLFLITAEHARSIRLKSGQTRHFPGSNPHTSKGAEVFMMQALFEALTSYPDLISKIYGFVIDSDSSAESFIRNFPHADLRTKNIFFDTGHAKKAVGKSIKEIIGTADRFGTLASRFPRMFMGIIKRHTSNLFVKDAPGNLDSLLSSFASALRADLEKLKIHYTVNDCVSDCPCLYERDEAKRLEAKIAAVAADELEQEECDAGETGDDDVDLCSGNLHLLDYRLQTAGRKRTSTKWFYDAQADSKTAESDAKVYERLCLLLDTLIAGI